MSLYNSEIKPLLITSYNTINLLQYSHVGFVKRHRNKYNPNILSLFFNNLELNCLKTEKVLDLDTRLNKSRKKIIHFLTGRKVTASQPLFWLKPVR